MPAPSPNLDRWRRGHTWFRHNALELLACLDADERLPRAAYETFRRSLNAHSACEERTIFSRLAPLARAHLCEEHAAMALPAGCTTGEDRAVIRGVLKHLLPHLEEEEAAVAVAYSELPPLASPEFPMLADVLRAAPEYTDVAPGASLRALGLSVMREPEPDVKVLRTLAIARAFFDGELDLGEEFDHSESAEGVCDSETHASSGIILAVDSDVPSAPARPAWLAEVDPRQMKGGKSIRSVLHGVAHAESYAIDLSWDILVRFGWSPQSWGLPAAAAAVGPRRLRLPDAFFADWVRVAAEEALHFSRWRDRLVGLGSRYGAESGHAMLWQSVEETAGDLGARLAIVHCVHEARGLDTAVSLRAKLEAVKDAPSLRILEANHADEITHVAAGVRWLTWLVGGASGVAGDAGVAGPGRAGVAVVADTTSGGAIAAAMTGMSVADDAAVTDSNGKSIESTTAPPIAALAVLGTTATSSSTAGTTTEGHPIYPPTNPVTGPRIDLAVSGPESDRATGPVIAAFHTLVRANFRGRLLPPFNEKSRRLAGMTPLWWEPLSVARSRDDVPAV